MKPISILIVEDEAIIAMEIKERIKELGYTVHGVVDSGEEAVKKALELKPDLIMMDIMLKKEMNGVQAAELISEKADIPIVFLTANTDNVTFQEAVMSEPYGYITKPFSEISLHNTIEMALYKHTMDNRASENKKWLTTLIQSIGEGVVATDKDGIVTLINPIAEKLIGWPKERAIGQDIEFVLNLYNEKTRELLENPIKKSLQTGDIIFQEESSYVSSVNGKEVMINDNTSPIINDQGNIIGAICILRDVTSQREIQARIQFMATHDELTKLPNRYHLNDRLNQAIENSRITGGKLALLYLDIDGFKDINDTFGHMVGDETLMEVSERLSASIRGSDIVARMGGDEFLFLLDNLKDTSDANLVANKILENLKPSFTVENTEVTISASIGISIFPQDTDDAKELLILADRAMYKAKEKGKNNFQHFQPNQFINE